MKLLGVNSEANKIWSVRDFSKKIKSILEDSIQSCWICGEVSNLRHQSSGHIYFTLKDADAQLSVVIFKNDAIQQNITLKEGKQILIFGEINVFESRGTYQLIGRHAIDYGLGKLQIEFDRLKERLKNEGLFDENRKKKIPLLPRKIGVITSPTGAALQDFISILKRKQWTGEIFILPAQVQGEGSAQQIQDQLKFADQELTLDLLIIARGGGSLEDLWCFNDEQLIRTLSSCSIPIISAIGHEIDFTLTDFAADKRVETPSAAAEFITTNWIEFQNQLAFFQNQLEAYSPIRFIENNFLILDDYFSQLDNIIQKKILHHHNSLQDFQWRLFQKEPLSDIRLMLEKFYEFKKTIDYTIDTYFSRHSQLLNDLQLRYQNLSIDSVLKRGFAIIIDSNNKVYSSAKDIKNNKELILRFYDGDIPVQLK